jgi:serine/threonine protein kinase
MNRSIDYRTDFYSLGVTFYQLLSDRLPFETTYASTGSAALDLAALMKASQALAGEIVLDKLLVLALNFYPTTSKLLLVNIGLFSNVTIDTAAVLPLPSGSKDKMPLDRS